MGSLDENRSPRSSRQHPFPASIYRAFMHGARASPAWGRNGRKSKMRHIPDHRDASAVGAPRQSLAQAMAHTSCATHPIIVARVGILKSSKVAKADDGFYHA